MEVLVKVLVPGAVTPEIVSLNTEQPLQKAVDKIADKFDNQALQNTRLVISPTGRKNGTIIAPHVTLKSLNFNPKEDVLELWRAPTFMSVGIYFKEGGTDCVRDRKSITIDMGTSLIHMVRILQNALDMVDEEFAIQYAEHLDEEGRVENICWLHCQLPLEDQNINPGEGHLLCYPVAKLLKTPEASLVPLIKGWLWKRSYKGDRISTKKRRLFVLSDVFLYYFKKERDSAPAGVIPLDYYVISPKIQKKKKKYAMVLKISREYFKTLTTMYKLQVENEDALDEWYPKVKDKCVNSGNQRVFGVSLKEIVQRASNHSKWVPNIVKQCISYVSDHGLDQEGIFRLSACASSLEFMRDQYDSGVNIVFSSIKDHNIPAALLKAYFRDLPDPLFTHGLFDDFVIAAEAKENKARKIAELFAELPPENYGTAKILFTFLKKVSEQQEVNKMTSANLATVFGPNLLVSKDPHQSVALFSVVNAFTEYLIDHHQPIFDIAEELNPAFKACKLNWAEIKATSVSSNQPGGANAGGTGGGGGGWASGTKTSYQPRGNPTNPRLIGAFAGPHPHSNTVSAGTGVGKDSQTGNITPTKLRAASTSDFNNNANNPLKSHGVPLQRGRGNPRMTRPPPARKPGDSPVVPQLIPPPARKLSNIEPNSSTAINTSPPVSSGANPPAVIARKPPTDAAPRGLMSPRLSMEDLKQQLEVERAARRELEAQVAILLSRIAELESK